MDYQKVISRNEPLPAGLTAVGYLHLDGYDHPLPDGVMVFWVTQQLTM